MLISGIRKTTLLDYPGKVATIIFTLGCNFRCHYCHNFEFVLPEKVNEFMSDLISETAFFNFLKTRIGIIDGVVITGGEPTIQSDLYDFVVKIKELGFLVKLDTNGSNPEILSKLLRENLLDYVAMDIKNDFANYSQITGINGYSNIYKKSLELIMNSGVDYELRTTIAKGYHSEDKIREIGKDITGAKKWFLQNLEEKNLLNAGFDGKSFISSELETLRKIGSEYVEVCEVRR